MMKRNDSSEKINEEMRKTRIMNYKTIIEKYRNKDKSPATVGWMSNITFTDIRTRGSMNISWKY